MKKVEGLRYTYVQDKSPVFHLGPFLILDGSTEIGCAASRAAALQITRALNREDLRLLSESRRIAARAKPRRATPPASRSTPQRRFRSKRKL